MAAPGPRPGVGGGTPCKNDGGIRRKFSKNTAEGTRISDRLMAMAQVDFYPVEVLIPLIVPACFFLAEYTKRYSSDSNGRQLIF